jgi:Ca2+-binding RTX toxin-like protein
MIVNRDDDDEDGYADYAGINPAASGSSSQLVDDDLVQLSISFSGVLASSSFKISFTYNAYADESVLTETLEVPAYDGETYEKYRHSLGEGLFRLWLVQPTSERRLIASEELVDLGDLQASGGEASKLYLEALNGANTSQSIHISVWKDEEILIAADAIKAIPIDPGLGLAAEIEIEGYNIVRGSGAISGTSGNDLILGSMYNDQIDAGMGDDVVVPFAGDDLIDLGSGSDLVFGFFGNKQFNSDTSDVVSYIEGGYVQDPEPESLQAFATGETDAQSVLVSSVNTATNGAQHPCVRSMNGRDVIAAYKWMFGDDLWLKLFNSQHINGRVIAVSDRRDGPPEYDIDYETAGNWPYTQLKKVTVKITYGQIDQIEAANQLRSAILNELIDDYYDKVKDFLTDIFASAKTDKVVFSEALEAWADLRQRNITYVAEIATLAAKLNPFFFPGGIGASAAQAFFELPDLAEAGVDALKSLFNLIPIIPGDTSDWENDDGEMPTAAALVNGQGQLFPDFAALSIGAALRLRIAAATGMKLFDVAKDVIKPAGNTLGFVWRRDFINGRAIPMALEVVPLASGKTTLVIGTAQVVPGTTHAATALAKAQQLAQTGLYSHITLARNWRTATGRIGNWKDPAVKALQNKIPDLIAVRWDGKVVPFEVQSSGDTVAVLRTRLENSMATLPTANQTEIGTSNIIPLSPG